MNIARRTLTGVAAAAVMIATTGAAFAESPRGNYRGWDNGARNHRLAPQPSHRYGQQYNHNGYKKRDNTGKAVALGIAAIMLGAILSQAGRDRHNGYED